MVARARMTRLQPSSHASFAQKSLRPWIEQRNCLPLPIRFSLRPLRSPKASDPCSGLGSWKQSLPCCVPVSLKNLSSSQ